MSHQSKGSHRRGNPRTYKLSLRKHSDVRLSCTTCRNSICWYCCIKLNESIKRLNSSDPLSAIFEKFFSHQDNDKPLTKYYVPGNSSPCCRLKWSIKTHKNEDQISTASTFGNIRPPKNKGKPRSIDGMLMYWQYNAAIDSSVGIHIDTLCTVGKYRCNDLQHYVVSPETALRLGSRCYPRGNKTHDRTIPDLRLHVTDAYDNNESHLLKVHVTIIQQSINGTTMLKGGDESDATTISKRKLYLSKPETIKMTTEKYDALILLFVPTDDREDIFPYVRWLNNKKEFKAINDKMIDSTLATLEDRLKHGGFEVNRTGGSNGIIKPTKEMLDFMHVPSTTPRQSKACIWVPHTNQRQWHVLYINCYKNDNTRHVTKFTYSNPQRGGQINVTDKLTSELGTGTTNILLASAKCKATMPTLCKSLQNKTQNHIPTRAIASHASVCQSIINQFTKNTTKTEQHFYKTLLQTCKITLLLSAVKNHVDVANSKSSCIDAQKSIKAFFETKILFRSRSKSNISTKARGRGGDGPGSFVFGLIDHSWSRRPLTTEEVALLAQIAREMNIQL